MSLDEKEAFLSRWSRMKRESREEEATARAAPPPSTPPTVAPSASPTPELPPVESLRGIASEYKDFLHPGVDEKLRQSALKKLFSDPHFNVIDLMDVYIDDYTKPDPIPEAMLRTLEHAKGLLFDDEKEKDPKSAEGPAALPATAEQRPLEAKTEAVSGEPDPGEPSSRDPLAVPPEVESKA